MAHIDDLALEDTIRLAGVGVVAFCSLFVPPFFFNMLGLAGILAWIQDCPGLIRWPVFIVLWGVSFIAVLGVIRGLVGFAGQLIPRAIGATQRIGESTAMLLSTLVIGGSALSVQLIKLALYPLRCLCEAVIARGQAQFGLYLQKWREEQELRRLYREEFSEEFRTFQEFKNHFHAGGTHGQREESEPPEPEPKKPDPFATACRLLGLPDDGAFTAAELKKRYLTLMKGVHPDVAGPNELAVQINSACTLIRERKGWS